jgi:hypothetical protein
MICGASHVESERLDAFGWRRGEVACEVVSEAQPNTSLGGAAYSQFGSRLNSMKRGRT